MVAAATNDNLANCRAMLAVYETYQAALLHAKAGRFAAAAGFLKLILADRPRHAETWLYHGIVQEIAGRLREAYESYANAAVHDTDPSRANIYMLHLVEQTRRRAITLEAEGLLGEAAAMLAELAHVIPAFALSLKRMARQRLGEDVAEPPNPVQFTLLHTWIVQNQMDEAQRLQTNDPEAAAASLERLLALGIDQEDLVEGLRNASRQFLALGIAEA